MNPDMGTPLSQLRFRGKHRKDMRSPSPYYHRAPSPEDVELKDFNQEATVGESSQPADEHIEEQAAEENAMVPSDIPADEGHGVEQMETN